MKNMSWFGIIVLGSGILVDITIAIWVLLRTRGLVKVIKELEINTNSIKDALIKATAESEHAKGVLEGKASKESPGHINVPDK